ncbi:Endospore coat-associated protein YheD [Paenibacillus solanacearum]|uniref:Endospore coat-associated protein YheD n=1 Tax=Paenibacillus solanacearum TaxID=2048548 RepID=A0A916K5P2_9BACL|nr:YheC/YheD family protein [Paenibacillus solanacearum]CAG7646638.1 Endospore coat-associated protein YheD [Paenibacillus solanacearum]
MTTPFGHHTLHNSIGIMTTQAEGDPPFLNRGFYRRLCLLGHRFGLNVFVFTSRSIDWQSREVTGYFYEASSRQWVAEPFPLPPVIYDRCFFSSKRQYAEYRAVLSRLKEHTSVRLLGNGLRSKWAVQQLLQADGRFDRHLPHTEVLRSMRTLTAWLQARSEAVLKPQGGSQGRGVLLVRRADTGADGTFEVRGRDARNHCIEHRFTDAGAMLRWLRRFVGQRDYLLQQYLRLQSAGGASYDVRALAQKDGAGRWRLTGMAVRRGQEGSLTSNLSGGGTVEPAADFLAREFGRVRAAELIDRLTQLSADLPEALESRHGRLVELGIDFGVDIDGNIWILELNSKPGRSIFTYLRDDQARLEAAANPLRYARYLLHQSTPASGQTRGQSQPLLKANIKSSYLCEGHNS